MRIATLPLIDEDRKIFSEQGVLYIKNFYDSEQVLAIQRGIYRLFSLMIESNHLPIKQPPFSPDDFDAGLLEMKEKYRHLLGQIYNAVKKIPAYFNLAGAPQHQKLAEFLLCSNMVGIASRGWGVRMDIPNEDQHQTQLHQDYTSQICSPSGIVIWSPLRTVTAAMGPVKIYLGSHREGVLDVDVTGSDSYGLQVRDPQKILDKYPAICPEVGLNDAVIIHMLTAHESTPNRGHVARWSMISRYFDFTESTGRIHGWQGGLQEGGIFAKIHPEKSRISVSLKKAP